MKHENVHSFFSRIASEHPGNIAIATGARQVSYRELEERSNSLANFLLAKGAAKGAPVAILTSDRVAIIVAILGILKARCVFAPLDPQIPEKRREAMMSLLAPEWLITESQLLHRVNNSWEELAEYESYFNPKRPRVESQPDDMCYVYFTSGSTGQPKAISGRLKGIDHFIRWEIQTLGLGAETRVSQILPPSFDGSLRDIFIPLCTGGTACVPDDSQTVLEPDKLIAWLERERINVIHCVPSLFRSLLNEKLTAENFQCLRYILMAGEPLLPADVKRWTGVFGERIQLINLYGMSETTMAKFAYFVKASDQERRTIPVGKPIEGAAAVVVDKRGRPCPRGIIGEIYIRTPYRALGYYNQPDLTREAFIPNPFSNDPNDIVYKTGDLGRVLEDGNYEYLGRLDRQVKIRGNRVELSEVEDVLRRHAAVSDVIVIDREDTTGLNYLCAYLVLDHEIDTGELQQLVLDRLPDYMAPSAFIVMESLPRTISGKIDRQALPAPGLTRAGMGEFVAPSTHVEKILAHIWTEVLGIEQIGIHDNFFRLGGHSLRATQILTRVRATLNVEVPLRSLFQTPTIAGLAALIDTKLTSPAAEAVQIKSGSRPDTLPLSFAQQRLWFIDQLEPGASTYNLPLAVHLTGPLNVQALGRTLTEIVRRHEALRTTFSVVNGNPIQVISDPFDVSLTLIDLSSVTDEERESAVQTTMHREARRTFDLARGPLLRVALIRLGEQEHIALLTMHHIISDGWSEGVLVRELATLYDAYAQGKQSPLDELKVQYADYAVWQREWLQGEVLEQQMGYWREQLAGSSGVLELPVDHPRPAAQSYRGRQLMVELGSELTAKLHELSRREGVTLFMTLLAGWQTLLARYSGQWDLNVGTPIANRTRGEMEELIGFFVNTLVLRSRMKPEASFREQLQQVRETCLGAYVHQDVPFEMLVEQLQPERHMGRTPLFQVMFALQNAPMGELELRGLKLEQLAVASDTAKFDVMLIMIERETSLFGWCDYSTDLFDEATVVRMLEHWRVLLAAAVDQPEMSLAELPLLSEAEQQQVFEWNRTEVEYPRERTIDTLFAEQAARTPFAVAVEYQRVTRLESATLSYEELNRRVNQLARYLRRLGVGPEVRVGVSIDRSLELIVGLLGILKAGGAYVPLDRDYPPERLRFMIEDAQLRLVLANEQTLAGLSDETGMQLVDLSAEAECINAESEADLASEVAADNLAYVIYTSGSTGTPKGVEVTHRAVLRLVLNTDYLRLTPTDRVAQAANTSFDASTFEIWGALLNGATIVPLDKDITLDTEALAAALQSRRISALFLTTALFNQLVQTDPAVFADLRAVLFGGEAVDPRSVRAVLHSRPPERLLHVYGPTEVTTFSTWERVTDVAADATTVPIGKPIANTEAYVLDESLRLTPVGVNGELYLGGDGLARGYLSRAELTAERFVPHAFARRAGERLYHTGDVVRRLPNGAIEFVGRRDAQVKVRGFRIELGEIETVLTQHPDVREAVAIVREPQPGNKQLVAYVVGEAPLAELRRYLKDKLPDYMAPQSLVKLEQLPLTTNGKIDRQALPAPDRTADDAEEAYVAPRTPEEELLAGIWAEVLKVDRVSVHDNFFDCGGHSLLATQITSRIKTVFNIEL
ncbi:MAG TPA: amino acid adenylation domain-containing protein, partial [Pyrinomonadaceae bacterium]